MAILTPVFRREPKLTPEEHARAVDLILRELDPDQRRAAETLLGRMSTKDRGEVERLLVEKGVRHWPRIEKLMLRFGDLTPAVSGPVSGRASLAQRDAPIVAGREWPLSAAATQVLLSLRSDRPAPVSPTVLVLLSFRELIARGELRPVEIRRQRVLGNAIFVATGPRGSARLPAPLDHLADHVAATDHRDLAKVVRKAQRSRSRLYSSELQQRSEAELVRRGLAEPRTRKLLGLWPRPFHAPTAAGQALAQQAVADDRLAAFDEALAARVHAFGADHGGHRVVVAAIDAAIASGIGVGGSPAGGGYSA